VIAIQSKLVETVVGPVLETLNRPFALTASTGVAALHIHGRTVHSWAGIGLGKKPVDQLVNDLLTDEKLVNALRRWRATHTLVIDEISMISADLFDKLDMIGRRVRDRAMEFGGIQIIVCGDFLQLPPVNEKFAFESEAWKSIVQDTVTLDCVYRQRDESFIRYSIILLAPCIQ
jgi:ATP-dependent DNA helicase PIF1